MATSPERAEARNRSLLGIAAPLFVFAALIVLRASVELRPYEIGWILWIGGVFVSGVGAGYGWARASLGR